MPLTNPIEVAVLSRTVTLNDAEIKSSASAGIEIIPAQGAGKIIVPLAAHLEFNPVTAYTTVGADDLLLALGGIAGRLVCGSLGLLNSATPRVSPMFQASAEELSGGDTDLTNVENVPLELWNWSGVPYTEGDAGNTLDVTVIYAVKG